MPYPRHESKSLLIGDRNLMGGGTEAFPDLGSHCQHEDCNQLDFLPFTCDGCKKEFCLEHRTYKSHFCPKAENKNRVVVICEACTMAIEKTFDETDVAALERHEKSRECDPAKKKKTKCPVKRCKEVLTFSITSSCKTCGIKVCLKHRFATDHDCKGKNVLVRNGMGCKGERPSIPRRIPVEWF